MKVKKEYKLKLIGTEIEDYVIEKKIWQGATSTVYKAERIRRNSPYGEFVAIKILHPYREHPLQKKQFIREAKIAMRLDHPNIVKVYKIGKKEALLYMIMEYVDGKSLRQMMQGNDIPPEKFLFICWEIGKALVYIHRNRILHLDVKPENIIVSFDFEKIKLTDFGYARPAKSWLWRRSFISGGTEKYMAPEQKTGKVDERTDIYSYGKILQEIFLENFDTQDEILKGIILKSISQNPSQRYQSMEDLMQELQKLINKNEIRNNCRYSQQS